MGMMRRGWLKIRALFSRRAVDRELDDELRFHVEMESSKNVRAGMSPEEARREALLSFGGVDRFRERTRDAWGTRWLEDVMRDARVGARSLVRSPAFAATTLLTLALGVGATTAVFSVVRGVLLRPLPFPDSDGLVTVWLSNPTQGIDEDITSYPNFDDWRAQGATLEHLVAVRTGLRALTGMGDPEEVRAAEVTAGFFEMLGAPLAFGRGFRADEVEDRAQRVTVLSHGLWVRRFGSDPRVVGRTVELGGEGYEVLGVTAAGGGHPADTELWVPLDLSGAYAGMREARGALWLPIMGRLAEGVSIEDAQVEMSTIAQRLEAEYPDMNEGMGITLEPLRETLVGDVRASLLILFAGVTLVLLIGCANVANLLLARGMARSREMAVRLSVGAGRGRLVRQVVTESVLIGLVGGAGGILVALGAVRLFVARAPAELPRVSEVAVDPVVLGFALGLSLATGLLFGVLPAVQTAEADPARRLREKAAGPADGMLRGLRPAFVAGQFALALLLVAGAGLLVQSFIRLQKVDLGFATEGVLVARISPPAQSYPNASAMLAFHAELAEQLAAAPGVESSGVISSLLQSRLPNMGSISVEARPELSEEYERFPVTDDGVSPSILPLLEMRLIAGRSLSSGDVRDGPQVAVVNETFVRQFLAGLDPVGQRFVFGSPSDDNPWITVVGVVGDARRAGADQEVRPGALLPYEQNASRTVDVLVKTEGDPAALGGAVRAAVAAVDPDLPMRQLRTLDSAVAEGLAQRRFLTTLLTAFAAIATLLAAVGTYGVMAYLVGRRTREIGIRVALGAERSSILGAVVREATVQAGVGLALGLFAAWLLGDLLESQLFAIESTSPTTLLGSAAVLGVVAIAASWLPAWRATRIDPTVALRSE